MRSTRVTINRSSLYRDHGRPRRAMAVGKILRLKEEALIQTLGIAASMASGLREFRHDDQAFACRASGGKRRNAALLAQAGFTSATNILEARRGFYHAMAGGYDEGKIAGKLGRPYFMQGSGDLDQAYPSGSLSHPAQDLILDLVREHDLTPTTSNPSMSGPIPTFPMR